MKKYIWILLLAFVLAGCDQNVEPDFIPTTLEETIPPETSCYVKESTVEKTTNGAVMFYDLPDAEYVWLDRSVDRLILASWNGHLKLTQGSGSVTTFMLGELTMDTLQKDNYRQNTMVGMVFYDGGNHQGIFVSPGLQTHTVNLPDFAGNPMFSPDGNHMYYCTQGEIRVKDLHTGIDRLLKAHSCKSQSLVGIHFDGNVLECRITAEDDTQITAFISTETGQTLAQDANLLQFSSSGDTFVAQRMEGTVEQYIAGQRGGQNLALQLPEADAVVPVPVMNGLVTYSLTEKDALVLNYFDLTTGQRSTVELPGVGAPKGICGDKHHGCLWILAKDPQTGEDGLYQWFAEQSVTEDEHTYISPYYDAENPDEEGLAQLATYAKELGNKHDVRIRIWKDAVANPGELTLEPEHQTQAIKGCLDALDLVLAQYPEDFFYKCVIKTLNISVVRSVSQQEPGVQYWHNGEAYIVLPIGCDYEDALAKGLGYVVDSHVLGNSSVFDDWGSLNPEGFTYGIAPEETLLGGETRAFADAACTTTVMDDRALTFYYAVRPGNGELFESEIMQQKLQKMCRGIRTAWRWKNVEESFPWEQYLKES